MRFFALIAVLITLATPALANGFASPSGNIRCYLDVFSPAPIDETDMVCLIFDAGWEYPPERGGNDGDCDLDRTRMVILPPDGAPYLETACHGDVFWPEPLGTISYGSEWSLMGYTCRMARDGVRCGNGRGDGFHLRRAEVIFD